MSRSYEIYSIRQRNHDGAFIHEDLTDDLSAAKTTMLATGLKILSAHYNQTASAVFSPLSSAVFAALPPNPTLFMPWAGQTTWYHSVVPEVVAQILVKQVEFVVRGQPIDVKDQQLVITSNQLTFDQLKSRLLAQPRTSDVSAGWDQSILTSNQHMTPAQFQKIWKVGP